MGVIREGLRELRRQSQAMSRLDAAIGAIASVVLLGVALQLGVTGTTDSLVAGSTVVVVGVALTGLGMTLYRLLHRSE